MCGIIGEWNLDGRPVDIHRFEDARDQMIKRGPDQFGLWTTPNQALALGHRRLSILDLSEGGRQPMLDPVTGNILVFNGEIYNFQEIAAELRTLGHTFHTRSDSEVILVAYRQWGTDCLERLVGMFGFAIWDADRKRLFLARDRFGVKPLMYARRGTSFWFSSRLAPLMQLMSHVEPLRLSDAGICEFLEMGHTCGQTTLVEGITKLPPGHFLLVDADGTAEHQYWSPDNFAEDVALTDRPAGDLLNELDRLVQDAVRSRLVSDVPLGVFLSGGIDSTLVTAVMQQMSSDPVTTFTVGFLESGYDESGHARRVAEHLGTQHRELVLEPSALLQEIVAIVDEFDEPLADTAAVPLSLVARLARQEVTVCLSGDGADELFLGYPVHDLMERMSWMNRLPRLASRGLGLAAGLLRGRRAQLYRGFVDQDDALDRYLYLRSRSRRKLNGKQHAGWAARSSLNATWEHHREIPCGSLAARLDLQCYLPDELMVKTDLATMMHSLESREPLLDHRLAEFALRLPMPLKRNKRILKDLLGRYVPREIWDRPKQGFNVPIGEWLRGPLRFLLDELGEGWAFAYPMDRDAVNELIRRHLSEQEDLGLFLWTCISLQRWQRRMQPWLA